MSNISIAKYFVHVPATAERATVVTASNSNPSKIYFLEGTGEIINKGLTFGCDSDTLDKIQKALKSLLGENAAGTEEDAVKNAINAVLGTSDDTYEADTVFGAKALTNGLTIAFEPVTTGEGEDAVTEKSIVLKSADGTIQASIPGAEFIKDGLIDTVAWSTETDKESTLVITWNTDAGKEKTEIDMAKFIDTYTVASDSENYLGIDGYEVSVKTTNLGDVNLVYDEDTKTWSAPEEVAALTGLATAADVAAEIVANEQVVAAALNNHEGRIQALEDADAIVTTVAQAEETQYVTVSDEAAEGSNDHDYKIGVTLAAYAAAEGSDAKELSEGLVDANALKDVLDDLWETFE